MKDRPLRGMIARSGEYRTDVFCSSIAPSSQELEPPVNPAWFSHIPTTKLC